jgi:hypothetical protein
MSLEALLRDKAEVRQGFATRLLRPAIKMGHGLQAPPRTNNFRTVADAFHYLLRFYLQRLNPKARDSTWEAERGVEVIGLDPGPEKGKDVPTISRHPKRLKAAGLLTDARRQYKTYLGNGLVTKNLLVAVHHLAHFNVALREGPDKVDWHALGYLDPEDAADLKALLELVDDDIFRASRTCILSPRLRAADLVGGADPGFILDDCLMRVMTAKEARVDLRDYYGLVASYLLLGLGGVAHEDGKTEQCPVTSIGIYFSRFGYLWKARVADILPAGGLPDLTRWFVEAACQSNPDAQDVLSTLKGPLAAILSAPDAALRKA